jgi:hypothetical protein
MATLFKPKMYFDIRGHQVSPLFSRVNNQSCPFSNKKRNHHHFLIIVIIMANRSSYQSRRESLDPNPGIEESLCSRFVCAEA